MARVFLVQTRAEMLKFWRVPAFAFFSLGLPLIIFTFFGLRQATQPLYPHAAITVGTYVMASMAAYTVGNVMVFSFGMALAIERGQKQDLLLRASPLPRAGRHQLRLSAHSIRVRHLHPGQPAARFHQGPGAIPATKPIRGARLERDRRQHRPRGVDRCPLPGRVCRWLFCARVVGVPARHRREVRLAGR